MKKFIFSFFLFSLMVVGAQAQKAACCKAGSKSAACEAKAPAAVSADQSDAAMKVASLDQTIEMRTDPITGSTSYVRKETSAADGSVSYVSLSFDATSNSFVTANAAMMAPAHNCTDKEKGKGKSCCAQGAASGKSCCAGKATAKPAEKVKS